MVAETRMISASCHCGTVIMQAEALPRAVTSCNCSICRRLGALWAYYTRLQARLVAGSDAIEPYLWSDRTIEFYRCAACGCCTHYESVEKNADSRFAINARCFALEDLSSLAVRRFDGANTWKYLD